VLFICGYGKNFLLLNYYYKVRFLLPMIEDAQKTFHCWEHDKFLPWIMTFRLHTGKQEQIFSFGKNILEKISKMKCCLKLLGCLSFTILSLTEKYRKSELSALKSFYLSSPSLGSRIFHNEHDLRAEKRVNLCAL